MSMDVVINETSFINASEQQLITFIDIADNIQKNYGEIIYIKPEGFSGRIKQTISKLSSRKHREFLFSIINRARNEKSETDFCLSDDGKEIRSEGCAIAFDFDHITISVGSLEIWRKLIIEGRYDFFDIEDKLQSIYNAKINNIADFIHVKDAYASIPSITFKEKVSSGADFWEKRCKLHPQFIFCGKTEKQIRIMSMTKLKKLFERLTNFTDIEHKDSSLSVKDNPKLKREYKFTLPDGTYEHFYCHFDLSKSERVHYIFIEKMCYIGYIGIHLPTAKY